MENKRKQLHPGAKWLFRITGYVGAIIFALFLSGFVVTFLSILLELTGTSAEAIIGVVLLGFAGFIVFVIVLAEIYAQMAYNRWFYEFAKDSLKIERGIIWKRYSNVPYQRVQNVDINRGILARLLGFSTVNIQTAGFSYSPRARGAGAEGHIPAVPIKEAEEIRNFIINKISRRKGQGL